VTGAARRHGNVLRELFAIATALACAIGAPACAAAPAAAGEVAAAAGHSPIDVVDDTGAHLRLAVPARRIVSLAPNLTEQLFAIGAGDALVAVSAFSDYPPAARALPQVARAQSVDLEAIVAARPELIVTWGTGYPPQLLQALRSLGIPTYVSEPTTLDSIAESMLRLGALTGHGEESGREAARLRAGIAALRERYASRPTMTVFYQVWDRPLTTLAGRHVIGEALAACGARNLFAALAPISPQVSIEDVVRGDPDVIVTAEAGGQDRGALDGWRRFPRMRAVARGALVTLDADRIDRQGPRIVEGIARLCAEIDRFRAP